MDFRIELIDENNLDEALKMEALSFADPWPRKTYTDVIIPDENYYGYIASYRDNSAGTVSYCGLLVFDMVFDYYHVSKIAVHPDFRRAGVGSLLLKHLIKYVKMLQASIIVLEVMEDNYEAQALYKKFGFEVFAKKRGYYVKQKKDALLMSLRIKSYTEVNP